MKLYELVNKAIREHLDNIANLAEKSLLLGRDPIWDIYDFEIEDLEAKPEPCKHEPLGRDELSLVFYNPVETKGRPPKHEPYFTPVCKHCGVAIKAKEWEAE